MVIDTHLHYGVSGHFSLDFELLKQQMDENGIDQGIISTVTCCEYQSDVNELMLEQIPQLEANKILLNEIQKCRDRFYLSFWCKPALEKNAEEVYTFIKENKQWVKGLKFHPYYSRMPLEDKRYESYIDIARQLELPVSVHTAQDKLSNPEQLFTLAKKYPTVPFVMVHMGLCSDNELAIQCLTQADNLYGDTTWVPWDKVNKAIRVCGSEKMMFGSDAPIDGNRSYTFYEAFLTAHQEKPTSDLDNLMYKNAKRIFKI